MPVDPLPLPSGAVADAIRDQRLIAVGRRIEPRDRLLQLVTEPVAVGIGSAIGCMTADERRALVAAIRRRR